MLTARPVSKSSSLNFAPPRVAKQYNMLKKLSFLVAAALIMATGCKDEDSGPVIDFDTLSTSSESLGAFPRLQSLDFAEFDLANLNSSVYQHTVDFVDGNSSNDVATYRILVAFDDNNPDNGDNTTDFAVYREVDVQAQSTDPETGNKSYTLTIPFADVAAFVGAEATDIISGDRFQFRTEVVKNDGRVFNSVNSTPAVTNAFGALWNFNVNATCPLADDAFTGDYAIEYGYVYDQFPLFGAPVQPFGPTIDRTVTLSTVAGSTTRRSFNYGTYLVPGYGFGTSDITIEFACDIVTTTNIDSGAGCGGGSIQASQIGAAPFDLSDDSTWTIEYSDFSPDGGCGVAPVDFSVVFTKL